MKTAILETCNGKIDSSGRCSKCFQVSQTSSAWCIRLIPVPENSAPSEAQGGHSYTEGMPFPYPNANEEPKEFTRSQVRTEILKAFEAGRNCEYNEHFGSVPNKCKDIYDYLKQSGF